MSWYGVAIYRIAGEPWEELLDTLDEAAEHLRNKADPALVAHEYGDDGKPTGVTMQYDPQLSEHPNTEEV